MTHTKPHLTVAACILLGVCAAPCNALESSVQSSARPFGLDIFSPVQISGSDSRAADFNANHLPDIRSYVNDNLSERQSVADVSSMALDPSALKLTVASDVRVYFVGEGAGYRNTLGLSTNGSTVDGADGLIFPDASTSGSYSFYEGDYRSTRAPLAPGDFVDVGTVAGGSSLDFFLIANGANGGTSTWWAGDSNNVDGIEHVVALAVPDSPYLVIGFEDLYGGGDRDYNDLVFAVDIGAANVNALIAGNEPGTILLIIGLAALAFWHQRRKQLGQVVS